MSQFSRFRPKAVLLLSAGFAVLLLCCGLAATVYFSWLRIQIARAEKPVSLDPTWEVSSEEANRFYDLGYVHYEADEFELAFDCFTLATYPDDNIRDGKEAIRLATKAIEVSGGERDCRLMDTLASAYAEDGQFEKAVELQKQACQLAPDDQKSDYMQRLELYEAGNPFRLSSGE